MERDLNFKFYKKIKKKESDEAKEELKSPSKAVRKFQWGKCLDTRLDMTGKFIKRIADLPSCCVNPGEEQTVVQDFYRNANIFITGATGFMGKILIEKLLVSCPNIGSLYVLIRKKKGMTPEERFVKLFEEDVFIRLRKIIPNFQKKLIVINGDITLPNLGMSNCDYEMIQNQVSVIFHGAANVRFYESLKSAANANIKGVMEIFKLAKKCKHLKAIMHVSTVYSNCTPLNKHVSEEFYEVAFDYKNLLRLVDTEPDEVLEKMTPSLINPWPNTYSFTKQIAEDIIRKECRGLPIGILRPGIIISTYNEPIRGWTDNVYGPTGVIIGAATGILRVINLDKEVTANLVPVDFVVNELIVAAWKTHENFRTGQKKIKIYNHVSVDRNPIKWGEFSYWNTIYGQQWPTILAVWYKEFHFVKSKLLFALLVFLLHTLPAYIFDAAILMTGKKPKMVKLYQRIAKFSKVISYFSDHTWTFSDDNTLSLWSTLSEKDRAIYPFDVAEINWDFYTEAHLLGLRVYLIKDDLDTLERGRKKWKRLKYLHKGIRVILLFLFSWTLYKMFKLASHFTYCASITF